MDSALTTSIGYYILIKLQNGENKLNIAVPTQFVLGWFFWLDVVLVFFLIFASDTFSLNVASAGHPYTTEVCHVHIPGCLGSQENMSQGSGKSPLA